MAVTNRNISGDSLVPVIEKFGDWDEAMALLANGGLQTAVLAGTLAGQMSAAKKLKALVKKNIRLNGPPGTYWPGYSPKYVKYKAKKASANLDKKWQFTGTYYKSIDVRVKGATVTVGVPKKKSGRVHPDGLTLTEIANILENGSSSKGIAARPLWRPTYKQFGGNNRISAHILANIRLQLKAIKVTKGMYRIIR